MIPKTQSVCKHCGEPRTSYIHAPDLSDRAHVFEPVSEPASTGEPPPDCSFCAEGNKPGLLGSGTGNYWHRLSNGELHKCDRNDYKEPAARPSEPSAPPRGFDPRPDLNWPLRSMRPAPQTSAELQNKCDFCRDGDKPTEDGFHTGIVNDYKCRNAAPQPVSEPAPSPTPSVSTEQVCQTCHGDPNVHDMMCEGIPPYWMVTRFETLVRMVDRGTQDTSALEEYLELRKKLRELATPSVAGTQPTPEERELLLAQFFPQGTPQVEEIASLTAELIKLLDGPPSLCNYCGHSFPKGPIIYGGQNHCPLSPNGFHGFTVTIGGPDNRPHIISEFLRSHLAGAPAQPGPQEKR